MENKILNLIKNKKGSRSESNLNEFIKGIKKDANDSKDERGKTARSESNLNEFIKGIKKDVNDSKDERNKNNKNGSMAQKNGMPHLDIASSGYKLDFKKENLTDLMIYKYYVDLAELNNFQIKSNDNIVVYINGDTLYVYERDGHGTQIEISAVLKDFKRMNKRESSEVDGEGVLDGSDTKKYVKDGVSDGKTIRIYDVNQNYLVLRAENNFIFYEIVRGYDLVLRECFVLSDVKQVVLFNDHFIYVTNSVVERKLGNNEERVILDEDVEKIFIVEDIVYYKVKNKIYNKMNSKMLEGCSLTGMNNNILLRNDEWYTLLDSDYMVQDRITIGENAFILDNLIGILKGNVINWLCVENNRFKVYGSTSIGNNVTVSGDKKDNELFLYVIKEGAGEEEAGSSVKEANQDLSKDTKVDGKNTNNRRNGRKTSTKGNGERSSTVFKNLDKNDVPEDKSERNNSFGKKLKYPVKKESNDASDTQNETDMEEKFSKISINGSGIDLDEKELYPRMEALIEKMFVRFDNEMKKRESNFKKKQVALLTGISEQMNKCFNNLVDKLTRVDKNTMGKKEVVAEFRKLFNDLLVPCVEAGIEEMRLQMVGEVKRMSNDGNKIESLLSTGKIKEACVLALEGNDDDLDIFVNSIDTDSLKQLSTSLCVSLVDRCTFMLDNGDEKKIEIIKKILGIIDAHEFEENDFVVFKRVLKRLDDFGNDDKLLGLLVETQKHLFGKAVVKRQMKQS